MRLMQLAPKDRMLYLVIDLPNNLPRIIDNWDSYDSDLQEHYIDNLEWVIGYAISNYSKMNQNQMLKLSAAIKQLTKFSDWIIENISCGKQLFLIGTT